ncbi:MAG: regulatory protein RecX [Acidobacteriota bacterium]
MHERPRSGDGQGTGAAGPAAAHEVALRLLSRRAYSARELTDRLLRRGFEPAVVRAEVARLEKVGLVDEEALARAVARDVIRRGYGRRGVAASLRRRGLGAEELSAAMATLGEAEERAALCAALARAARRSPHWRELPEERRKVVRYLLARGFGAALVRAVLSGGGGETGEQEECFEPGDPQDLS